MRTINISLPENLVKRIEALLVRGEYASRSEVLRTALRIFFALEKEEAPPTLTQFSKRPLKEVKKELSNAGYSADFVNSVVKGLKKSSVYNKK